MDKHTLLFIKTYPELIKFTFTKCHYIKQNIPFVKNTHDYMETISNTQKTKKIVQLHDRHSPADLQLKA